MLLFVYSLIAATGASTARSNKDTQEFKIACYLGAADHAHAIAMSLHRADGIRKLIPAITAHIPATLVGI